VRAAKEHDNLRLAILDLPTTPSCQKLDPDIWFPEQGPALPITVEAKRLCGVCLVRVECLAYALAANERHGIWGGLSADARKKLRATSL
jgi:WhiB family redox-sensing transcriptional regulator